VRHHCVVVERWSVGLFRCVGLYIGGLSFLCEKIHSTTQLEEQPVTWNTHAHRGDHTLKKKINNETTKTEAQQFSQL
jgi:hypothetical protein